jgi:hypothetical protein
MGSALLPTPYIRSVFTAQDRASQRVEKLVVWNHDDKPLKSDVAQQAINLARVQNFLGSQSGIQ